MIDSEMIKQTSLANADFEYLPSIILVDGEGKMHGFQKPDGTNTHAMPTPQSLGEMKKAVNSPIIPSSPTMAETLKNTGPDLRSSAEAEPTDEAESDSDSEPETEQEQEQEQEQEPNAQQEKEPQLTIEPITTPNTIRPNNRVSTPQGQSYIPTPMVAPQKGGAKKSFLPKIVLGSLAKLLRSRRRGKGNKRGKRSTRKHTTKKRSTLIKRKN
jgi:hypothetical protein